MLHKIVDRLFSVKSIVTLLLTAVFSYLAIRGMIDGKEFMTIFTVIIGFYFGTQSDKKSTEQNNERERGEDQDEKI